MTTSPQAMRPKNDHEQQQQSGQEIESGQSKETPQKGIVYLLINSAMHGLVKIGKTKGNAKVRMDSLYSTGVPVPFECVLAVEVEDSGAVEKGLHDIFAPQRINSKREFFEIEQERAIAALKLTGGKDVTPRVNEDNNKFDKAEIDAGEALRKRRPNLNLRAMDIPIGSQLDAVDSDDFAIVVNARKVKLNGEGEAMYLSEATKRVRNVDYPIQPTPYWKYEGKLLKEIYESTYSEDD